MMKGSLNPLSLLIFCLILIIAIIMHLMYGDCQSSKLHYIIQCYYVPKNLPKWLSKNNFENNIDRSERSFGEYSGKWKEWHEDGTRKIEIEYLNGKLNGRWVQWYKNGNKEFECNYSGGILHGRNIEWLKNGKKKLDIVFKHGQIEKILWPNDEI